MKRVKLRKPSYFLHKYVTFNHVMERKLLNDGGINIMRYYEIFVVSISFIYIYFNV